MFVGGVQASTAEIKALEKEWSAFELEHRTQVKKLESEQKMARVDLEAKQKDAFSKANVSGLSGGQGLSEKEKKEFAAVAADYQKKLNESDHQFDLKILDLEKNKLKKRAEIDLKISDLTIVRARDSRGYKKSKKTADQIEYDHQRYKLKRPLRLEEDLELLVANFECNKKEKDAQASVEFQGLGAEALSETSKGVSVGAAEAAETEGTALPFGAIGGMLGGMNLEKVMEAGKKQEAQKKSMKFECSQKRDEIRAKYEKKRLAL